MRLGDSEAAWYDVAEQLKQKVAEYRAIKNSVMSKMSLINSNPELKQQWSVLSSRMQTVESSVDKVTSAIDSVYGWFKTTFGFDGYTLPGLGAIPLIPIAAAVAAVAALTKVISDLVIFEQKLNTYSDMKDKVGEEKAAAIIKSVSGDSSISSAIESVSGTMKVVGALGISYLILKRFI